MPSIAPTATRGDAHPFLRLAVHPERPLPRCLSVTCVRCTSRLALDGEDLCPLCSFAVRIEAARGVRRLADYLENWAAFEEWSRRRSAPAGVT